VARRRFAKHSCVLRDISVSNPSHPRANSEYSPRSQELTVFLQLDPALPPLFHHWGLFHVHCFTTGAYFMSIVSPYHWGYSMSIVSPLGPVPCPLFHQWGLFRVHCFTTGATGTTTLDYHWYHHPTTGTTTLDYHWYHHP
jgi:hypothetical protein